MKIAMLLSGGVDSSVALAKLAAEGIHQITAYYLKIWLEDDFAHLGSCPWQEDLDYAQAVCQQLGIPLKIVSLQTAYWERVVAHTVQELKAGRTPSPDILCNQRVKFGAFQDGLDDDYDCIASGHYARTITRDGMTRLIKGVDPVKDQSYFLSHLSQNQLQRSLFPLGGLLKSQVRQLAADYDLPNKLRKDSQGICFLGKIKYNEFVRCHLGDRPGPIIHRSKGQRLGQHQGYWYHTIGQRKGLGLSGGPWFVVGKDLERDIIYVEHLDELGGQPSKSVFRVGASNWLADEPQWPQQFDVKIRHGAKTVLSSVSTSDSGATLEVRMSEEDGGVASGQYAVFYQGEECWGGGVII